MGIIIKGWSIWANHWNLYGDSYLERKRDIIEELSGICDGLGLNWSIGNIPVRIWIG
jgi:hypothetical protein